jgi:membrane protein insertase Oxa1/YidC/SpoIIIJ
MRETQTLYAANGVRILSPAGFVGFLVQLPLLSGLFAAVRGGLGARVPFLWIGDLARSDALLAAGVSVLGGAILAIPQSPAAAGGPSGSTLFLIGGGATLFFLWSASSAVALSIGAGSLVSALQSWFLARDRARLTPA